MRTQVRQVQPQIQSQTQTQSQTQSQEVQAMDLSTRFPSVDDDSFDYENYPGNQMALLSYSDADALLSEAGAEMDVSNYMISSTPKPGKKRVHPTTILSFNETTSPRAKKMKQGTRGREVISNDIGFETEIANASNALKKRSARSVADIVKSGGSIELAKPEIVSKA